MGKYHRIRLALSCAILGSAIAGIVLGTDEARNLGALLGAVLSGAIEIDQVAS